jgi:hypothetical protein
VAISLLPADVVADTQDAALLILARSLLTAIVVWHLAAFANRAHAFIIGSKTGSSRGSVGRPRRVIVVVHPRSTDASASICAFVGVAGSFPSALLIFACSLSTAWSQRSSEPVDGPVGAALALVLRLGAALGLTGTVSVVEPPLHPVSHRTAADATIITPGLKLLVIGLFSVHPACECGPYVPPGWLELSRAERYLFDQQQTIPRAAVAGRVTK